MIVQSENFNSFTEKMTSKHDVSIIAIMALKKALNKGGDCSPNSFDPVSDLRATSQAMLSACFSDHTEE